MNCDYSSFRELREHTVNYGHILVLKRVSRIILLSIVTNSPLKCFIEYIVNFDYTFVLKGKLHTRP